MTVTRFHLAQLNMGRIRFPLDDPRMAGFMNRLDDINALADRTDGFVWRLQTEEGNATALHPYEDDRDLINMSVWESIDALDAFTYQSAHVEVFRQRQEWFEPSSEATFVMWWVPTGHIPSIDEAIERLDQLRRNGPTAEAFTIRDRFEPNAT